MSSTTAPTNTGQSSGHNWTPIYCNHCGGRILLNKEMVHLLITGQHKRLIELMKEIVQESMVAVNKRDDLS